MPYFNALRQKVTYFNEGEKEKEERGRGKRKEKPPICLHVERFPQSGRRKNFVPCKTEGGLP